MTFHDTSEGGLLRPSRDDEWSAVQHPDAITSFQARRVLDRQEQKT